MHLREFFEEGDICIVEFCKKHGIPPSLVYYYMKGQVRPSRDTAMRIEKATGGKVLASELRKIKPTGRVKSENA